MPELPEVEVSRLGISPHIIGQTIDKVVVRQPKLRWMVPSEIQQAAKQVIVDVRRRAKYLILTTAKGDIILHLGMSGKLRVVPINSEVQKHDHVEIQLTNGQCLRMNDARRFGACLWRGEGEPEHTLLQNLGPEPLTEHFDGERLYTLSRGKSQAVKTFIMDNHVVVGVGNIYANESLFMAGIDPRRGAGKVSQQRYVQLAEHIKQVLAKAIEQGGTTLKDFVQVDGSPGYFAQQLLVYGRAGKACSHCGTTIKSVVIGQRNTFYCPSCQK
ncbi:bifunctional DNA-formamidopyrimidine glycosylase/DNA-(apurinic or apyrimidinic site) lyase [Aestuariibacter sp. AA17]|uniref:Formamidopyrimidine-DNA glycosylase n=1 Tax=Fluctibacter corallii TaxID=2984329 RepID=A0ABT3ABV0_9ALTE|nr:bifunctional DNA-formamidopyrimidine glycosylase/DNA-(apurinic or apyrimidinic site) lyase [Aestuariibacter sp. AA17]MCV2886155.1 bifunctional DNA-formamidopyrimidine glycosylase/DNA-(apurinic or apyrimidinic site) lyase [Aestuariibacter sp. AA17]